MDVSIIIINYKTYALTKQCIESVLLHTQSIDYEIILVDNCSGDESSKKLRSDFPKITIIENSENIGFGRANNVGISQAKGKYILMLNSDTILTQNAIYEMFSFMEGNLEYSACGCNLVDGNGNNSYSFGNLPTLTMEFFKIKFRRYFPVYYKNRLSEGQTIKDGTPNNVGYISGADIFIKKDVFDNLGGFDKKIFMYFEETDLFARMHKIGLKSCVLPHTQIIHLEGGSVKNANVNKFKIFETSRMYYYHKHHSGLYCFLVKLCVLANILLNQKEGKLERMKIVCKI